MNPPSLSATVASLDIGDCKICLPVGQIQADGRLQIIGMGQAASRGVSFGHIVRTAHALKAARKAVVEAEEMAKTKITSVFIGTSTTSIKWGQRRILVPRHPDCAIHQSIELVLALGLTVAGVVFKGSASGTAVLTPEQKQQGALVIDIGASMTHYAVFSRGVPIVCGSLPFGGNAISLRLALDLSLSIAYAEHLKRSEHNSVHDHGRASWFNRSFSRSGINFQAIQRITRSKMETCFEKIRSQTSTVLSSLEAGVVLTGGSSRIAGLEELCSQLFGLPASLAQLASSDYQLKSLNNPEFSTSIGLVEYGASLKPMRFCA